MHTDSHKEDLKVSEPAPKQAQVESSQGQGDGNLDRQPSVALGNGVPGGPSLVEPSLVSSVVDPREPTPPTATGIGKGQALLTASSKPKVSASSSSSTVGDSQDQADAVERIVYVIHADMCQFRTYAKNARDTYGEDGHAKLVADIRAFFVNALTKACQETCTELPISVQAFEACCSHGDNCEVPVGSLLIASRFAEVIHQQAAQCNSRLSDGRKWMFHIGIARGAISDKATSSRDASVFKKAVQLCEAAKPGQTLICEFTYRQLPQQQQTAFKGPLYAKGGKNHDSETIVAFRIGLESSDESSLRPRESVVTEPSVITTRIARALRISACFFREASYSQAETVVRYLLARGQQAPPRPPANDPQPPSGGSWPTWTELWAESPQRYLDEAGLGVRMDPAGVRRLEFLQTGAHELARLEITSTRWAEYLPELRHFLNAELLMHASPVIYQPAADITAEVAADQREVIHEAAALLAVALEQESSIGHDLLPKPSRVHQAAALVEAFHRRPSLVGEIPSMLISAANQLSLSGRPRSKLLPLIRSCQNVPVQERWRWIQQLVLTSDAGFAVAARDELAGAVLRNAALGRGAAEAAADWAKCLETCPADKPNPLAACVLDAAWQALVRAAISHLRPFALGGHFLGTFLEDHAQLIAVMGAHDWPSEQLFSLAAMIDELAPEAPEPAARLTAEQLFLLLGEPSAEDPIVGFADSLIGMSRFANPNFQERFVELLAEWRYQSANLPEQAFLHRRVVELFLGQYGNSSAKAARRALQHLTRCRDHLLADARDLLDQAENLEVEHRRAFQRAARALRQRSAACRALADSVNQSVKNPSRSEPSVLRSE